jgi:hypothetical protein
MGAEDWAAAGALAAAVIAALALGVSIWSAVIARRSASAADKSAEYAGEVAAIERARRADEVAEADRQQVQFRLQHVQSKLYLLTNAGTGTAYGVTVDLGDPGNRPRTHDALPDVFPERYAVEVLLLQPGPVTVQWHNREDRSDERRSRVLPP